MTRREQIEEAVAKEVGDLYVNSGFLAQYLAFKKGAEWADENPDKSTRDNKLTEITNSYFPEQEKQDLEAKLTIAVEALVVCSTIAQAAKEALSNIRGVK